MKIDAGSIALLTIGIIILAGMFTVVYNGMANPLNTITTMFFDLVRERETHAF